MLIPRGADMNTYSAINAGGKLLYALSPKIDFVVSLHGDISFTDKDVLGTDDAWVWPLALGFSFNLQVRDQVAAFGPVLIFQLIVRTQHR